MAALEPYYCSNSEKYGREDSEVDNRLGKNNFVEFVKDANSVVGFSPSGQFCLRRTELRHVKTP